jgi:hypothetical protein
MALRIVNARLARTAPAATVQWGVMRNEASNPGQQA